MRVNFFAERKKERKQKEQNSPTKKNQIHNAPLIRV
jgi:hypothetical protein